MVTLTGPDRFRLTDTDATFTAIGFDEPLNGWSTPVVDRATAIDVIRSLPLEAQTSLNWYGPTETGGERLEVFETRDGQVEQTVLRPDADGHYHLAQLGWTFVTPTSHPTAFDLNDDGLTGDTPSTLSEVSAGLDALVAQFPHALRPLSKPPFDLEAFGVRDPGFTRTVSIAFVPGVDQYLVRTGYDDRPGRDDYAPTPQAALALAEERVFAEMFPTDVSPAEWDAWHQARPHLDLDPIDTSVPVDRSVSLGVRPQAVFLARCMDRVDTAWMRQTMLEGGSFSKATFHLPQGSRTTVIALITDTVDRNDRDAVFALLDEVDAAYAAIHPDRPGAPEPGSEVLPRPSQPKSRLDAIEAGAHPGPIAPITAPGPVGPVSGHIVATPTPQQAGPSLGPGVAGPAW